MNDPNTLDTTIERLIELLDLESIEENIFRGESQDIGSPQVFGGQVLGQALTAASRTVKDRNVHSLHAYFLRRGDFEAPIVYEVDRARDGGSFSNRRVIAVQHGEQIFNMTASFQKPEEGLEHQTEMPNVAPPEELDNLEDLINPEWIEQLPQIIKLFRRRNIGHLSLMLQTLFRFLERGRHIEYLFSALSRYASSVGEASTVSRSVHFIDNWSFKITTP
jgi:acyl-CoA thioesterase-2